MPQSDEAAEWFDAVYSTVQQIPTSRVTTYGHIAFLTGFPRRARQVGVCLKHLPSYRPEQPELHFFHSDNVPWQRVINARGEISVREGDGKQRQAERLRTEGVEVLEGRTGELSVDLGRWGWFPDTLDDDNDDEPESLQNGHG